MKPEVFFKLYWARTGVTCHQPRMPGNPGSLSAPKNSHTSSHIYPCLGNSNLVLPPFTGTSCCILTFASVLLCGPSVAALTHIPLYPYCQKEKEPPRSFPRSVSLWSDGLLLCFHFLSHPLSSSRWTDLQCFLCTFSAIIFFCASPFSSFSFPSSSSTSLPFALPELATSSPDGLCP